MTDRRRSSRRDAESAEGRRGFLRSSAVSASLRELCVGLFLTFAGFGCLFAQSEIVTAGYMVPPTSLSAAPGQIVTLFVRGVTAKDARAESFPLPTSLSGL